MIRLESSAEGTILPVWAQTGARRPGITGEYNGALRVAVSEAPEKGKANQAITKILTEAFHLSKSAITLTSGSTSRQKRYLLHGLSESVVRQALQQLLGAPAPP